MSQSRIRLLVTIVAYSVLLKVLPYILMQFNMSIAPSSSPYPWNLTPILAVALFAVGAFPSFGRMGVVVAAAAWLIGDLLTGVLVGLKLGWTEGLAFAFYPYQYMTYLGLFAASACGLLLRRNRSMVAVFGTSILAATLFYVITNFGSWFGDVAGLYSRDLSGLLSAYVAGIPFFRNSLTGTVLFSMFLFSPVSLKLFDLAEETAENELAEAPSAEEPGLDAVKVKS